MRPRPSRLLLVAALLAPAVARAEPGFAVCIAVDEAAGGRVVATAQPFAADSARAATDASGFARAARSQGKAEGSLEPACHWEPSRDRASDYLRRLRQGAGRKGADAAEVDYAPAP